MTQVLAWHSTCWLIQDGIHSLGAFVTSPGAAGTAAVVAAVIAAKEVQRTRAADNADRQREDLWERFEWVVDRSTSTKAGKKPVLTAARAVAMLVPLRDAAEPLGDSALVALIQGFLDHVVASIARELGL